MPRRASREKGIVQHCKSCDARSTATVYINSRTPPHLIKQFAGYGPFIVPVMCRKCELARLEKLYADGPHIELAKNIFNLLANIKGGARSRGLEFDLVVENLVALWLRQEGACALSGVDMEFSGRFKASLDRIDNSVGYLPSNVRWVCAPINVMRGELSDEEFRFWCANVVVKHS